MAANALSTETTALTEKKMDMALDDIIKMSKKASFKGKRASRTSNKSQRFINDSGIQRNSKVQRFMNYRSSIRQAVLSQRRRSFKGNQFPVTTAAARRGVVATIRNRAIYPSKQRFAAASIRRDTGYGNFARMLQQRMDLEIELKKVLDDWNTEFVTVEYLQQEYKKMYDDKVKKMKAIEEQLAECKEELVIMKTLVSLKNKQMDRIHIELVDAQVTINQHVKDQQILEKKMKAIEDENKRLHSLLYEKEVKSKAEMSPSKVIEEFKNSIVFKLIVQDHVLEARDHIYDVEVKALERKCIEEGFIRGFMKGVRLVQRKAGVEVEGLTPSQASDDPSSYSDSDEIESELQVFTREDDDIEIS